MDSHFNEVLGRPILDLFSGFLWVINLIRNSPVLIFVLVADHFYGRSIKSLHRERKLGIRINLNWVKRPVLQKVYPG
jgi:hypothetical protein